MPETTNAYALRDSVPPAGNLPFFARFLEGQNKEASTLQAAPEKQLTLKYPSDRDEWEGFNDNTLEAAAEKRMTLKYPSDRDEDIDPFRNS